MNQANFQGMAMQPAQAQSYIQRIVVETVKQQHRPQQGWQTSVTIQERAIKVLQL